VLVQADAEAYLPATGARRLLAAVSGGGWDFAVPVTNEPESPATRCDPPFLYQTPALLDEAAAAVAASGAASAGPAEAPDAVRSSIFAARREALRDLPPSLALDEAVREAAGRGKKVAVDRGAYVHRYGRMDAQAREDLAAKVPPGVRAVLDVGCSNGATAAALRAGGVGTITGIEPDPGDAAAAAAVYDRVIPSPLESIEEEFPDAFDAILFGDVLEHLENPAAALHRVRPWLAPGGRVVASVPNVGHWSVIADLLEGRFDYVPYSILSGTHVRFFTRRTLEDLFDACGYAVREVEAVRCPPSPRGEARLTRLRAYPGASPDLDAVEFIAVAEAAGHPRG
ncbi:MAG TPA: class I SAM-dependent methyltransferase, partial [Thermoanaerobaculia bacterium]|nr:class I SAM-dependent methyltransferase [Thermoanaerobaculia bacterium]